MSEERKAGGSRYATLDGLRGIFLVFMLVVHLNMQFKTLLGKLNHHYFGWVEDAQGFVFISGLVVGLVYGGILLRKGDGAMVNALIKRCKTIFVYQAGLIFILAATAYLVGGYYNSVYFAGFEKHLVVYTLVALSMIEVPMNMGILPMYLLFMAATPLVMRQFQRGHYFLILGISICLWFVAQTQLVSMFFEMIERYVLAVSGYKLVIGIFFDLFGWQVVYFLGLYFGYRLAAKDLDLSFFKTKQAYHLFILSVVAFVLFGILDRVIFNDLVSPGYSASFLASNKRQVFPPVYLINFLVDLYMVSWLLIEGRHHAGTFFGFIGSLAYRLTNWKQLVFLGQHSLQVFAFHILLQYLLAAFLRDRGVGQVMGSLIIIVAVFSLYIPAFIHAEYAKRHKQRLIAAAKPV